MTREAWRRLWRFARVRRRLQIAARVYIEPHRHGLAGAADRCAGLTSSEDARPSAFRALEVAATIRRGNAHVQMPPPERSRAARYFITDARDYRHRCDWRSLP